MSSFLVIEKWFFEELAQGTAATPGIVTPGAGSITITGQLPIALRGTIAQPGAGSVAITGIAPTVVIGTIAQPGAGSITFTGQLPIGLRGSIAQPGGGSITLTGQAATLLFGLPMGVGSITITGLAPLGLLGAVSQVGAGSVSITGLAPTALRGTIAQPGAGSIAATGQAPSIATVISVPAGSISCTGAAPTGVRGSIVTPGVGELSIASAGADPHFGKVVLLAHFDAVEFTRDHSPRAVKLVDLNGTFHPASATTAGGGKFEEGFNGTDPVAGLVTPFGYQLPRTFTVEFFAKIPTLTATPSNQRAYFFDTTNVSDSTQAVSFDARWTVGPAPQIVIHAWNATATDFLTYTDNVFQHFAFSFLDNGNGSSRLEAYVGGVRQLSLDKPHNTANFPIEDIRFEIGGFSNNLPAPFVVDDLRVTYGVNRYTGTTLTVPTSAFPNNAPDVVVNTIVAVPSGAIGITGLGPTVVTSAGTTIAVPAGAITLTGQTPTAASSAGTTATPSAGAISFIGQTPDAVQGALIPVPVGSITLTGLAATAIRGTVAQPGAGSITIAGQAPTSLLGTVAPPGAGSIALTGLVPTAIVGTIAALGVGAITITGQAPSAVTVGAFIPGSGAIALAGLAPSLLIASIVQPGAGSVALTGLAPTLVIETVRQPGAGSIAITGLAPVALVNVIAQPGVGSVTLTGAAPDAQSPRTASPGVGAIGIVGLAPTIIDSSKPPEPDLPIQGYGGSGAGGGGGTSTRRGRARMLEEELPTVLHIKARSTPIVRRLGAVHAHTQVEASEETIAKAHCGFATMARGTALAKSEAAHAFIAAMTAITDDPDLMEFEALLEIL